jgi:hypothetical protein
MKKYFLRFISLLMVLVVPLLLFGMATLGLRTYSEGRVSLDDMIGLCLQIALVVVSVYGAIVLWRLSSSR